MVVQPQSDGKHPTDICTKKHRTDAHGLSMTEPKMLLHGFHPIDIKSCFMGGELAAMPIVRRQRILWLCHGL